MGTGKGKECSCLALALTGPLYKEGKAERMGNVSPPISFPEGLCGANPQQVGRLVWCTPAAGGNNSSFVSVLNAVQNPAPCKASSHLLRKLWPSALNLSLYTPPEQQKPFLEKQWQARLQRNPAEEDTLHCLCKVKFPEFHRQRKLCTPVTWPFTGYTDHTDHRIVPPVLRDCWWWVSGVGAPAQGTEVPLVSL